MYKNNPNNSANIAKAFQQEKLNANHGLCNVNANLLLKCTIIW